MALIKKIKLHNFKRFRDYTLSPNEHINILVGDNEAGKSSILEAIDLVASGNVKKVESIGVEKLLNIDAANSFLCGKKKFDDLPKLFIELYLDEQNDHTTNGKNNSDKITCDGLRLICEPNKDLQNEIIESIQGASDYFPYDYYSIRFSTFADEAYSGYKKKLKSILIDSTSMSSDYATNDFIKRMYNQYTEDDTKERASHKSKYRQLKDSFQKDGLKTLNEKVPSDKNYSFGLRNNSAASLESDLMIYEDKIGIDNKGTGKQVFIKTDFALEKAGTNVDVILIEEPENHLSHINLRKLIESISTTRNGQLFITTHNSLISTRLELQNLFIMHENSDGKPVSLHDLKEDTAKYFMKAPVANIIEYALSKKTILVEGPAEYMLIEKFYTELANHKPEEDSINIMTVYGLSFKRYLDIAKLLKNKIAIVTDNDGDSKTNCIEKYSDYSGEDNIKIFYDNDDTKRTFEIILHDDNNDLCVSLFGANAKKYMLNNKTESAYKLLSNSGNIVVPKYIKEAIEWIKK
jgi:predicted ATP-dependent endonuclease of OLD family